MGTRADVWIGQGETAEWLGSFAFDGYPQGAVSVLFDCGTEADWRQRVQAFLAGRRDATLPAQGWPWPWDDSTTTDYSYAFFDGKVWACCFGHSPWQEAQQYQDDEEGGAARIIFPNMTGRKNVRLDQGSGLLFFSVHNKKD